LKVRDGRVEFYANHPKRRLAQITKGFDSKIFTSATLSPTKDVAYLFGLKDALTSEIAPYLARKIIFRLS
jgi:Rad3-related DNA helicase